MKVRDLLCGAAACVFVVLSTVQEAAAQEPSIELPVELIGFPVIILAVRLSNFAKKLAYSLNPRTYASRSRRSIESDDMIDMAEAEKRLVAELGENVCVYIRVCLYHAEKASKTQGKNRVSIDWNDIFRNLSRTAVRNGQSLKQFPSDFQLHPEKFSRFMGPIRENPVKRGRYGLQQNVPNFQGLYTHSQQQNPYFQRPHHNPIYGNFRPVPALPPGYLGQQGLGVPPQSFTDALNTIARNDDLRCVFRLLCELTSGPSSGQAQQSILPFNINMESVIGLLSAVSSTQSPILEFGKAALLGYSSKGSASSCVYAYPKCPRDPDRLVDYLNNHNGGFFKLFNGIRPSGLPLQQALHLQQQFIPHYPQNYPNYPPYHAFPPNFPHKNVAADKRIQNKPVQYVNSLSHFGIRFPPEFGSVENNVVPQREPLVFPEQTDFNELEQQVREPADRREKAVAFPADELHFQKPPSGLNQVPMIFPDRTGTGELRLDVEDLKTKYDDTNFYFPYGNNYRKLYNNKIVF